MSDKNFFDPENPEFQEAVARAEERQKAIHETTYPWSNNDITEIATLRQVARQALEQTDVLLTGIEQFIVKINLAMDELTATLRKARLESERREK